MTSNQSSGPVPGADDWVEVYNYCGGESYEWHDLEAFYSPSARQYFWISGGGCSCSYLWEYVETVDDLENGDREALIRAVKRHIDDDFTTEPGDKAEGVRRIRTFKEPKGA